MTLMMSYYNVSHSLTEFGSEYQTEPLSPSLPMNGCVTSVTNQYRVSRSCHLYGESKWVIPPEQFAAKW
jgi:hypothetical protein